MQRQRGRGARGSRSQLMNIGARRKRSARTGQHDRIDTWITDRMLERGNEPKSNGVAQTVHRRITQVQDRHSVTHLILDCVKEPCHSSVPSTRKAPRRSTIRRSCSPGADFAAASPRECGATSVSSKLAPGFNAPAASGARCRA